MRCSNEIVGLCLLAFAVGAGPIAASAAPSDSLAGRYGFNWESNPSKTRCRLVTGKLLAEFHSKAFACNFTPQTDSSTAVAHVVCTRVRPPGVEYLIFKTRAQCEDERLTQASNGD